MATATASSGFRSTCLGVCGLFVLLSAGVLVRGAEASMAEFEVPAAVLASPHYQDAIRWVYLHMLVIGLIVGWMGLRAEDPRLQRGFSRLMCAASAVYAWLDLRASDTALGEALYRGPGTVVPVLVCVLTAVLFGRLGLGRGAA